MSPIILTCVSPQIAEVDEEHDVVVYNTESLVRSARAISETYRKWHLFGNLPAAASLLRETLSTPEQLNDLLSQGWGPPSEWYFMQALMRLLARSSTTSSFIATPSVILQQATREIREVAGDPELTAFIEGFIAVHTSSGLPWKYRWQGAATMIDVLETSPVPQVQGILAAFSKKMGSSFKDSWNLYEHLAEDSMSLGRVQTTSPTGLIWKLEDLPGMAQREIASGTIGAINPLLIEPVVTDSNGKYVSAPLAPLLHGYVSVGLAIALLDYGVRGSYSPEDVHDLVDRVYFDNAISEIIGRAPETSLASTILTDTQQESKWGKKARDVTQNPKYYSKAADRVLVGDFGILAVEWKVRPSSVYYRVSATPNTILSDLEKPAYGADQCFSSIRNCSTEYGPAKYTIPQAIVVVPGPSWMTPLMIQKLAESVENRDPSSAPPSGILSLVDIHELAVAVDIAREHSTENWTLVGIIQAWRFDPEMKSWPLGRYLAARGFFKG